MKIEVVEMDKLQQNKVLNISEGKIYDCYSTATVGNITVLYVE